MKPDHADAPPLDLTAEQVTVLYENAPTAVIATIVNATILTMLEWPAVPHSILLVWLFSMYTVSGSRALLFLGFRRHRPAVLEVLGLVPVVCGRLDGIRHRMGKHHLVSASSCSALV